MSAGSGGWWEESGVAVDAEEESEFGEAWPEEEERGC